MSGRILLFHSDHRCCSRRSSRPLATRRHWRYVSKTPQLTSRARSSSVGSVDLYTIHHQRPYSSGLCARESLPLHACRFRLGSLRVRHHDHDDGHQCVQSRLVPRSCWRGCRVAQLSQSAWRVHHQLFSGGMGAEDGHGEIVRHPGGYLPRCFFPGHRLAGVWETLEELEWATALQDDLNGVKMHRRYCTLPRA